MSITGCSTRRFDHLLRCVNGFLNLPIEVMQKFALQRGERAADALPATGHPRLHTLPARFRTLN